MRLLIVTLTAAGLMLTLQVGTASAAGLRLEGNNFVIGRSDRVRRARPVRRASRVRGFTRRLRNRRFRPPSRLGRLRRVGRRSQVRGFRRRAVRVTRRPNSGSLRFSGFPLWAARALESGENR